MTDWTETKQRGVFQALLSGKLGVRPDTLRPEFFTGPRRALAEGVLTFRKDHGAWPTKGLLDELARRATGDRRELRQEARLIAMGDPLLVPLVLNEAREELKKRALEEASVRISELALEPASSHGEARAIIESALSAAEEVSPPFVFGEGVVERHLNPNGTKASVIAPTGFTTLDRIKGGGLFGGELGLILGPTKRGKSQFACYFGASSLLSGLRVLHLTLELRAPLVARRYDRTITGMSSEEIASDPHTFQRIWAAHVKDPTKLQILDYPRYSITTATVGEITKKELDRTGEPLLLIVDYGSILRPSKVDTRHQEVGRIHEALSSLCQRENIPCWSPFQTNRFACLMNDSGDIKMEHAGESYEAMQHADLILTLCQNPAHDEPRKRIRISVEGSRESASCIFAVKYDWTRTSIKEDDDGEDPEGGSSAEGNPRVSSPG
jgi:hypothetical protein